MKRKKNQDLLQWGRPDKWEILLLVLYGIFLYLFNDTVNIMNIQGWDSAMGTIISGIKINVMPIMWVSLILFHIFLFTLVSRSIWQRNTTHKLVDMSVGILVFIGVFLLIIPTVASILGVHADAYMDWFFGLGRMTVYHIGMLLQVIGIIYFAITK